MEVQARYVRDLYRDCEDAIVQSGNASDTVIGAAGVESGVEARNPGNAWALFKGVLDATSRYCGVNVTGRKWAGVLAGWDVYGFENGYAMVESLRIDFGVLGPFGVM